MSTIGVFINDQYKVDYGSVKQRRQDINFLLNIIVVEILHEYCVLNVLKDITIQGMPLYVLDPTETIIQQDLFKHYHDLDRYIRNIRSCITDKLLSVIYKLSRDMRFSLAIDFIFTSDTTTLVTFTFLRKQG